LLGGTRRLTFLQKRSTRFKAVIDLNKKKMHEDNTSPYVRNVDLIYVRQQYKYREHEEENDKTDGRKFMLGNNNNNINSMSECLLITINQ
jgi:hypothetical protein